MSNIDEGLVVALSKNVVTKDQFSLLPTNGSVRKLYITSDNNNIYRWDNALEYVLVSSVGGGLIFLGTFDALNGTPPLSSGSGTEGDYYIVSVGNDIIVPAIDGITTLSVGDQVLSQAKTGGGTEWVRVPNINAIVPPIFVSTDTVASTLDSTYIVTANGGDVTITIPASNASNEGRFFRIVKEAGNSAVIVVPQSPDTTFLGGETDYIINNISEGVTVFSSGIINGNIKIQDSTSDRPVIQTEYLGDTNTDRLEDGNWKLEVEGDFLIGYRREVGIWVERFRAGSSLITDRFILEDGGGSLVFINDLLQTKTLVKPSIDGSGVVLGNPGGRVAFIYNGELLSVEFNSDTLLVDDVQIVTDEIQTHSEFSIQYKTSRVEALICIRTSFANVPVGTKARLYLESVTGAILAKTVSKFDFDSGKGQVVIDGVNDFMFTEEIALSEGFNFFAKIELDSTVDLRGTTVDIGDGFGSRFVPYTSIDYYLGEEQNVTTDMNVVAQIESKIGDDRLSYNALKDTPNNYSVQTKEPTGFLLNSITGEVDLISSELLFDDNTRAFTIQPRFVATEYDIMQNGVLYTYNAPETVILDDIEGMHYVYFDEGVLYATTTFEIDIIYSKVFVTAIYWDVSNQEQIYFGDERHGCKMDGHTHARIHQGGGTLYLFGLGLNTFDIGNGNDETHAQFGMDSGQIKDEDLLLDRTSVAPTTGLPVYYKSGATGTWRREFNSGFSVLNSGTANDRLVWNEFTGGSWQKTEITQGDFVLCHVFATNDINYPFIAVMGQEDYTTTNKARQGAIDEVSSIITTGLPFAEFVLVGTVIFQTRTTYSNSIKSRIVLTDTGEEYVDWRGMGISPNDGGASVNHNALAGLQGGALDDYYHLTEAERDKLSGIEDGAEANQSDAEIKTQYENNADTNAFTDAEKTNLSNQSGTNTGDEPDASETVKGIVERATDAEAVAGTDTERYVTPKQLADNTGGSGYILATWGAKLHTVGFHPAINSPSNSAQIASLGIMASMPVPTAGILDTITYYNNTADNTTTFQIIKNGVVAHTFTCVAPYGAETGIGLSVDIPDNVAIRYSAGTAPTEGLYTAYIK